MKCNLIKILFYYIMIVTTLLPIFFLYFVLLSGYCSEVLNCGLQRYMHNGMFFKHLMIFLSIYIFTFVLNWYTFDSLQINHVNDDSIEQSTHVDKREEIITKEINLYKLLNWFIQSLCIYIIFLITTKSEVPEFLIFFTIVVLCIISQFILKSISNKEYSSINNKLFISYNTYNGINAKMVNNLHNITTGGYLISIIVILTGFIRYYNRQYKEHKKHWDFTKFIFGTTTCGKLSK